MLPPTTGGNMRILVWPGTTEIGREVARSLRDDRTIEVLGAGTKSHEGDLVFRETYLLPNVKTGSFVWLDALQRLIEVAKIDFVYPAHDDVGFALAGTEFVQAGRVIGSPVKTVITCRSKARTYEALKGKVRVPGYGVYPNYAGFNLPAFVKPDAGQGSQGTAVVDDWKTLMTAVNRAREVSPEVLVCEYLPGTEFTIDCFSTRGRGLQWFQVRSRDQTRAGISVHTSRVKDPGIVIPMGSWATSIDLALPMWGAWFFQVKLDGAGNPVLLEVAPRIPGGAPLARANGVNLPLLSVYEAMRLQIRVSDNDVVQTLERPLMNQYRATVTYDTLYMDLDDTLIHRGKVNPRMIALLYQVKNSRKAVILLTRSKTIPFTLGEHRISADLFDKIIGLGMKESKATYVTEKSAVFIDDSFSERIAVRDARKIPVFDASGAECLVDDRA